MSSEIMESHGIKYYHDQDVLVGYSMPQSWPKPQKGFLAVVPADAGIDALLVEVDRLRNNGNLWPEAMIRDLLDESAEEGSRALASGELIHVINRGKTSLGWGMMYSLGGIEMHGDEQVYRVPASLVLLRDPMKQYDSQVMMLYVRGVPFSAVSGGRGNRHPTQIRDAERVQGLHSHVMRAFMPYIDTVDFPHFIPDQSGDFTRGIVRPVAALNPDALEVAVEESDS